MAFVYRRRVSDPRQMNTDGQDHFSRRIYDSVCSIYNQFTSCESKITMTKGICILFCLLLVQMSSVAQDTKEDVLLPDEVMRQVVSRILIYNFKPRQTSTTVPLAESQVKQDWLPEIRNVAFELVPDKRIIDYENGVFLIEKVERAGTAYSINVGWGDLDCDATGVTWKFRLLSRQVRLWLTNMGWGRGCGRGYGNGPPVIRGLELGEVSPNEIRGYEFFNKGKLNDIRIGKSTREDIKRLFSSDCEAGCGYDHDWNLRAEYISAGLAWTSTVGDNVTEYFPKEEFIGKLESLSFTPKKQISFRRINFPSNRFSSGKQMSIGDAWGEDGFEGAVHTSYGVHEDGYGLRYTVYDEETFNNLQTKQESKDKRKMGDLIQIEYLIPDSLKEKVYYGRPAKKY